MKKFKVGDVVKRVCNDHPAIVGVKLGDIGIIIEISDNWPRIFHVRFFNGVTVNNDETNLELVSRSEENEK